MAHYVLDTGFFILSRDYYPDVFPTFWERMNDVVKEGVISSVHEVKKELERYGGEQKHLVKWIKDNSNIFTKPDEKEQNNMKNIFEDEYAQGLISKNKMLEGGPFADPLVIAKAMSSPMVTVVTRELPALKNKRGKAQGAPKIPDICNNLNINCITPEQFMQEQNWKF